MNQRKISFVTRTFICFLTLAFFSHVSAQAVSWPDPDTIPSMSNMETMEIAKKMRHNGIPTNMRTFSIQRDSEPVVEHYKNWFSQRGTGRYVENMVDGFTVIGAEVDGTYHSVKFREIEPGKTVGSFSSSLIPKSERDHKREMTAIQPIFVFNSSAKLLNRVESIDGRTYSDVSTYEFNLPRTYLSNWMTRTLKEEGWRHIGTHGNIENSTGYMFQKNSEHAEISVSDHFSGDSGKSMVNIIWVKE